MKKKVRTSVKTLSKLEQNAKKNIATAMLAAFALVIAFVWRDVIQSIVNDLLTYFNVTGSGTKYNLIAALVATLICTIGIMYFSRWGEGNKK